MLGSVVLSGSITMTPGIPSGTGMLGGGSILGVLFWIWFQLVSFMVGLEEFL